MAFGFLKKEGGETAQTDQKSTQAPLMNSDSTNVQSSASSNDDIFSWLAGEGDIDEFFDPKVKKLKKKKSALELTMIFSGYLSKFCILAAILTAADSSLRSLENSEYVNALPICSYLSFGIEWYENDDCNSLAEIAVKKQIEKKGVEETIANNLLILVPKRLESGNVSNSPEIQFIKERSGDSRTLFKKTFEAFQEIVDSSSLNGQDIECSKYQFNEKGEFQASCEFYGFDLESSDPVSHSSRMTAIDFMERLSKSDFKLMTPVKSFNIAKYSSVEAGTKGTFTTSTKVDLSLKYSPNNNIRP